jgi:hypothetical protein
MHESPVFPFPSPPKKSMGLMEGNEYNLKGPLIVLYMAADYADFWVV